MGGIFNALTNIVEGTIKVIANVAGGVVGGAFHLAGGVLDAAGNIIGNLISVKVNAAGQVINGATAIVEGVVDSAGNIIGRIVNNDGVKTNVVINVGGNVFNTAGKLLGNIFAVKGNVVKAIVNSINGIIGIVTEIAGNILRVKIYVFLQFVKVMANLIGLLSKLSNNLVKIFAGVLNGLAILLSDIAKAFEKFFTTALLEFNDFICNPALKAARDAYAKVVASVTAAITKAKTNIADQVNNFDTKMKDEVALAVNKVNKLASDLTEKLNLADVSPELKAKCGKQLSTSLEIFGGKDVPYLTECLDYDLDAIAKKATTTAGGTSNQAKALVASLRKCLDPVTASPKDTAVKTTAKECLDSVSVCTF